MQKLKKLKWWHWLLIIGVVGAVAQRLDPEYKEKQAAKEQQEKTSAIELAERNKKQQEIRMQDYAYQASKKSVLNYLKAPSTASFTGNYTIKTAYTDNRYVIIGEVDAQNSFGAMLRNYYECDVKLVGSYPNDVSNWQALSCKLISK